MLKKVITLILALTIGSAFLTGCGTKASDELVVAYYADNPIEESILKFSEETGIKVVPKPVTGDFFDQLKTGYASKTEPDVFFMDIYQFANFSDAGLLLDLNQYVSKEHMDKFNQNLLSMFQYEGGTYGIPKDYNTLGLFYNKDMFDEAGVEYPTNEWTWDNFINACEKLKAYYEPQGKYALVLQNEIARFQPILEMFGASFDYDEKGYPIVNTAQVEEGLKEWKMLFEKGYAITPKDLGRDWDGDAFDGQDAAMTIDGNWMNTFMAGTKSGTKYGVVGLPSINGNKANMFFTVAWSASINTKSPENATKFIEWITSDEMTEELLAQYEGGNIPPTTTLEQKFLKEYDNKQGFVEAGQIASRYDYGLVSPMLVANMNAIAEKMTLDSNVDIKAELDTLQKQIEEEYTRLKK